MEKYYHPLIFMLLLIFSGCQPKSNTKINLPEDPEAQLAVVLAMEWAGGWQKWTSLKSVSYTKENTYYNANGLMERQTSETHFYEFVPEKRIKISWTENGDAFVIDKKGNDLIFTKNGSDLTNKKFAEEYANGAAFVWSMPFNWSGANIEFEGETEIDGKHILIIRANYGGKTEDETGDIWWYFVDEHSGEFKASTVYHHPTYAHIVNHTVENVAGMKLPGTRTSYRTDSLGNIQYVRATFLYRDYQLKF